MEKSFKTKEKHWRAAASEIRFCLAGWMDGSHSRPQSSAFLGDGQWNGMEYAHQTPIHTHTILLGQTPTNNNARTSCGWRHGTEFGCQNANGNIFGEDN